MDFLKSINNKEKFDLKMCINKANEELYLESSENFLPDDKKYFKEAVRLGFPGETPEEKMKECLYTLVDGKRARENPKEKYPKIVKESYQVFECTWVKELDGAENDKIQEEYKGPYHNFNGITSEFGAHFILKIDNILMK